MASFTGSVHPKTEPQDVDMMTGEVQVKMEPEVKERGEKGDQGREHHSDNDSSATCSADEDVEAESERRCVFFVITVFILHVRNFTRAGCVRVFEWGVYLFVSAEYSPWKSLHCSALQALC